MKHFRLYLKEIESGQGLSVYADRVAIDTTDHENKLAWFFVNVGNYETSTLIVDLDRVDKIMTGPTCDEVVYKAPAEPIVAAAVRDDDESDDRNYISGLYPEVAR